MPSCLGTSLEPIPIATGRDFEWKTLASDTPLMARSDATGALWVMFGIDSGFENFTEIYYRSATISASPHASAELK